MPRLFSFETDVDERLELLSLDVRRRLDLAGVHLSLAAWKKLSFAERLALCHLPAEAPEERESYRVIAAGFAERAGEPARTLATEGPPKWRTSEGFEAVRDAARSAGAAVELAWWAALDDAERFALVHLAAPKRAERFAAALAVLGPAARG